MDIYAANLPYDLDERSLLDLFARQGEVKMVKLILDSNTGRFKGYAFITMNCDKQAKAAISALNGTQIGGRKINVTPAQDQKN